MLNAIENELGRSGRPLPRGVRCVPGSEYERLLGYPPGHEFDESVRRNMELAYERCERDGQPTCHVIAAEITGLDERRVNWKTSARVGAFESAALTRRLRAGGAQALAFVVVSAGQALDERVHSLQASSDLVATYFLDRLAAAWCEELLRGVRAELATKLSAGGLHVLAPLGPGHEDWDVAEQARLLEAWDLPATGMPTCNEASFLEPRYSLSAVFGLAPGAPTEVEHDPTCSSCSHHPCSFRRPTRGQALALSSTP
jgi:hypothetical protein